MSQTLAVDYSFARPNPAAVAKDEYVGVGRYIGGGSTSKHLTAGEVSALHAQGLGIWVCSEGPANRALGDAAEGAADARLAVVDALALGLPSACPIFFAVDFDATAAQVADYFSGVRSVLGDRAGIYGGINVTSANLAHYRWQTAAWSGGKVDPTAHIYQRVTMTHPISGCDEDVLCHPFPLWSKETPVPTPAPLKPTRVEHARVYLKEAIALLEKAVDNGRTGTVRTELRAIRAATNKLPKE